MIVYLSIVDRHLEPGNAFVGGFHVDIPQIDGSSHYDMMAVAVPLDREEKLRPYIGLLLSKEQMVKCFPDAVRWDGSPL